VVGVAGKPPGLELGSPIIAGAAPPAAAIIAGAALAPAAPAPAAAVGGVVIIAGMLAAMPGAPACAMPGVVGPVGRAVLVIIVGGVFIAGAAAPAAIAFGAVACVAVIAPAPGEGLAVSAPPQAAKSNVGAISASVMGNAVVDFGVIEDRTSWSNICSHRRTRPPQNATIPDQGNAPSPARAFGRFGNSCKHLCTRHSTTTLREHLLAGVLLHRSRALCVATACPNAHSNPEVRLTKINRTACGARGHVEHSPFPAMGGLAMSLH
jgi:hypothetical protein